MRRPSGRLIGIVALVVAWCPLAVGPAVAGSIKGAVLHAGPPPEKKTVTINIDQYVCGKSRESEDLVLGPNRGVRWAVVSLQTPPPGVRGEAPPGPVQVDQQQCVFVPRVVIVPVGGTVEFLNSDRLLHNIRGRATVNRPFNRTQPKGRTIPMVFQKAEVVRVDCDLHPWMRAWVVVAEHPFYTITNDQGEFLLDNVPPGRYTIQLWQEALGTVTKDVSVADGVTTVTVEMSRK